MPVVYTVTSVCIVKKKKGLVVEQSAHGSYKAPNDANKLACENIQDIMKRENFFSEEDSEERAKMVSEIMEGGEPWASKYYDLDGFITKWCPSVPELNMKKYDVRILDNELH
jgi:hypothetical protein